MQTDAEASELISDLLVRAGMLMEVFSPALISVLPESASSRRRRIRTSVFAGIRICALTTAAWALSEAAEPLLGD